MNSIFFSAGTCLSRQAVGIPMGSDPAPFIANLFLFYHKDEFKFEILKHSKSMSIILYLYIQSMITEGSKDALKINTPQN